MVLSVANAARGGYAEIEIPKRHLDEMPFDELARLYFEPALKAARIEAEL